MPAPPKVWPPKALPPASVGEPVPVVPGVPAAVLPRLLLPNELVPDGLLPDPPIPDPRLKPELPPVGLEEAGEFDPNADPELSVEPNALEAGVAPATPPGPVPPMGDPAPASG